MSQAKTAGAGCADTLSAASSVAFAGFELQTWRLRGFLGTHGWSDTCRTASTSGICIRSDGCSAFTINRESAVTLKKQKDMTLCAGSSYVVD